MRNRMRFVGRAMAVIAMLILVAMPVRGGEVKTANTAGGKKTSHVYSIEQRRPGPRVESVLTDPHAAVTATKDGTGWLLHRGTKRDSCARPDATSGLRRMCVGW